MWKIIKIAKQSSMKNNHKNSSVMSFDKCELITMTLGDSGVQISEFVKFKDVQTPSANEIINAVELHANDSDYLCANFRLLTATLVGSGSWKSTDFSDENVLKSAIKKIVGIPLKTEHILDVENTKGYVKSAWWSDVRSQDGYKIPSGIDGLIAINAKLHPNTAENVRTGATNSNSVTIEFEWKPSHEFKTSDEFNKNVGKLVNGKEVTRIVTKILNVHETSLVFLGADPYAKQIDANDNLIRLDIGSIVPPKQSGLSATKDNPDEDETEFYKVDNKKINVSCKTEKFVLTLTKEYDDVNTNKNTLGMSLEVAKGIKLMLGLSETDELTVAHLSQLAKAKEKTEYKTDDDNTDEEKGESPDDEKAEGETDDQHSKRMKAKKEKKDAQMKAEKEETEMEAKKKDASMSKENSNFSAQLVVFQKENIEQKNTIETLRYAIDKLSAAAAIGETYLNEKREIVIEAYKKNQGIAKRNIEQSVIETFNKETSVAALDGFASTFGADLRESFSTTCNDCKSKNIEFRSSVEQKNLLEQESKNSNTISITQWGKNLARK